MHRTQIYLVKHLTLKMYFVIIINGVAREWRNRQTRTFEGRVLITYGFKSRLSHQPGGFLPQEPAKQLQADMAKLADALDSGSSELTLMQVQVLLSAPKVEAQPFRGCASTFLVSVKDLNLFKVLLSAPKTEIQPHCCCISVFC